MLSGLVTCLTVVLSSPPAVDIQEVTGERFLGHYVEHYLEEAPGGIDEIRRLPDAAWTPGEHEIEFFGTGVASRWFRVQVQNSAAESVIRYVENLTPLMQAGELYIVGPRGVEERRSLISTPYRERESLHPTWVYQVQFPPQSQTTLYYRSYGVFGFDAFRLLTLKELEANKRVTFMVQGLMLGLALILIVLSVSIGVILKDVAFLTFPVYVLFAVLGLGLNHGTTQMLVWPDSPELVLVWGGTIFGFHICFAGLFFTTFLQLREHLNWLHRMIVFSSVTAAFLGLVYGLFPTLGEESILYIMVVILLPGVVVAACWRAWHGYKPAMILVAAFIPMATGSLIQSAALAGWIEFSSLYFYGLDWSYGFFMLVLAAGLGERFYELREAAADARSELSVAQAETEAIEALNQERTAFFQSISHELRTPLTLILNPLDAMRRQYGDDSDLDIATRNARRLLRLVNQLLDFQKLEAGKKRIDVAPLNITKFMRVCGDYFVSACSSKNIEFEVTVEETPDEVFVFAEVDALEKVAFNYLSNALKYTPDCGTITFGLTLSHGTQGTARLFVKDTGPGISPENQKKLFEVFSQVDGSTSREFEGTGLGLALAKSLAEEMGATVGVYSQAGEGATFYVDLQTVDRPSDYEDSGAFAVREWLLAAQHQKTGVASEEEEAQQEAPGTARKVLVVDDLLDMRQLISEALRGAGLNVQTAANGQLGLEKARAWQPDLILTDWMMPVMTGPEFIRAIREDKDLQATPTVLLTAKSDDESKLLGAQMGADAFLGKPFNEDELTSVVKNLLALKEREREVKALNRRLTEQVLKRYLPPDLVEDLIQGDLEVVQEPKMVTATVLFSDLQGFTKYANHISPTELSERLNEYLAEMTDIIFEYGGTIDKFIGDAIMVLFGAPRTMDPTSQARAASACAQAMQRRMALLMERWRESGAPTMAMRIGVHQGPMVVGSFGSASRSDYTAIGANVNFAARIEPVCIPGEVFVSEEIAQRLGPALVESAGTFELKGFDEPPPLYRLSAEVKLS